MADMLVKLYTLPSAEAEITAQAKQDITIRRAIAPEKTTILAWVEKQFNTRWMSECDVSFKNSPPSCWIAVENQQIIGFACYECTCKNFFGPIGIGEAARGRKVGKALLLACLNDMKVQGYGYAIIGGASDGVADFYRKTVGATVIEDSSPGIYKGMLRG
ncbi:MAG: GNAT family N-acetyltransferase [Cyanobacteriota bacterium]|nr:GNAT family N-acetyltransferase [Cyanobacteriota bacterium]